MTESAGSKLFLMLACVIAVVATSSVHAQTYFFGIDADELLYDPQTRLGSAEMGVIVGHDPGIIPPPTAGFSMGVSVGSEVIDVTEVSPAPILGNPAFFSESIEASGFTVGCIFDFANVNSIVLDTPEVLILATLETEPTLLGNTPTLDVPLEFVSTLGVPPVENIAVTNAGVAIVPSLIDGSITVAPVFFNFLRGDSNGDGIFTGLIDGVFLLDYGFANGPTPPCLSAADADDSGSIVTLLDALFILNYQFIPGSPAPPTPGPTNCGFESTTDTLSCDDHPCA